MGWASCDVDSSNKCSTLVPWMFTSEPIGEKHEVTNRVECDPSVLFGEAHRAAFLGIPPIRQIVGISTEPHWEEIVWHVRPAHREIIREDAKIGARN